MNALLFLLGSSPPSSVVTIADGSIRGTESAGVRSFRGVPFAAPPVKSLRFAPPQPVTPWPATLDATDFKHNCLQSSSAAFMGWPQPPSTLSEDCLYLNVYAPAKAPAKPAPVLFWIFGGGYQGGGGNETRLNGTYDVRLMAEEAAKDPMAEDLVVVTINYRLNVFGFIASDELRSQDAAFNGTGNYGILDQRAAMQWVQRNIAAFGGDPKRVFIVGQSAGASSVSNHLVREKSWGLFSAAGLESGAFAEGPYAMTVADQREQYLALLNETGCNKRKNGGLGGAHADGADGSGAGVDPGVQCLLDLDASTLLNVTLTKGGHWGPTMDGVDLVASGPLLASQGKLAKVPILVGAVSEDINRPGTNCRPDLCTEQDFRDWAGAGTKHRPGMGWNASEVARALQLYGSEAAPAGGNFTQWYWAEKHAGADSWGACPARRLAKWATEAGSEAYYYYWTYAPLGPNGHYPALAHHACEQPFVFHVLSETAEQDKEDGGVYHIASSEVGFSKAIVRMWAGMAAAGRPTQTNKFGAGAGADSPLVWPAFSKAMQSGLVIGGPGKFSVKARLRADRCALWDGHFWDGL